MKKFRITALVLTAMIAVASTVGCGDKKGKTSSSTTSQNENIGTNKVKVSMNEEADENETVFKLNSVYLTPVQDNGSKYLYFDVTIHNSTDTAYSLSCLNNFYIQSSDGTTINSHISAQMYARNNFREGIYTPDPFDVPANGDFSGIMGGFVIDGDLGEFTVGFFQTRENNNDKETVINVNVTPADIKDASELLK